MPTQTLTEQILSRFHTQNPHLNGVEVPPKIFVDMEGAFVAFEEGQSLTVRFPVKTRYQNPLGMMQGGMITAAIDNAYGPLSFMVGPPSVTTHMHTEFVKAVTPDNAHIDVEARVVEITRRLLYLSARVTNPNGEVVALGTASFMFLRGQRG
jgi:uncharacterized protein (TIGR00369 family)